jgi:hypothetical protein
MRSRKFSDRTGRLNKPGETVKVYLNRGNLPTSGKNVAKGCATRQTPRSPGKPETRELYPPIIPAPFANHGCVRKSETCGLSPSSPWEQTGGSPGWSELIGAGETIDEVDRLRRCTYSGRPLGGEAFVLRMEERFGRHWREPGRPRKPPTSETGTQRTALVLLS